MAAATSLYAARKRTLTRLFQPDEEISTEAIDRDNGFYGTKRYSIPVLNVVLA